MKAKNLQIKMKGFTLIELLVVITIIGILATIVVVNLNSARGKGQDTAIKEQMSQLRAQAALYYDDNYGYTVANGNAAITGTCPTAVASPNTNVFDQIDFIRSLTALQRNSGSAPNCYLEAGTSAATSQKWALTIKMRLPSAPNGLWCVDSIGNSLEVASGYIPSSNNFQCQN